MLISKKTHCFHCSDGEMTRSTIGIYGTRAKYICNECEAHVVIDLYTGQTERYYFDDAGKVNRLPYV